MINKKEIGKLSPQERIKKLKLMEDERKKEVEEIGSLIKESIRELKNDKIAEEIAPEAKAVDISRLFETGKGQRLERTARNESPTAALMEGRSGYQTFVTDYDYSKLKRFERVVSTGGALTEDDKVLVGQIGERLNRAERYVPEGEKYASILNASRATLKKLKDETGLH